MSGVNVNLNFYSALLILSGMIMGAAISTVGYNLKLRHPTLDIPLIDYDLVLLIQPVLMLGISIGVVFNLIFADWMVTILIILLSLGNRSHYIAFFMFDLFFHVRSKRRPGFVLRYLNQSILQSLRNLEEGNRFERGRSLCKLEL